ncbi:MAG: UvrD-helicase domain-containing protein [Christensenella sp.]|nr:UvrD-helicase domain-containing protein [Christensenella sp.]
MLTLNEKQQQAVTTTEGAVLVLAGAGSGKTRVLTQRVAYLINEKKVAPWEILAITFTNKAAQEMKDRIAGVVAADMRDMWISTFHAMCVRMLRRYADKIGYTRNFLIYDTDDSLRLIKKILEKLGLKDNKAYSERYLKNLISKYKNDSTLLDFYSYAEERNPFIAEYAEQIYEQYHAEMQKQNAMDFDDLLLNTLLLLETEEEARRYYQHKFRYVLVDEYQDTNMVQYKLVKILSAGYGNLFVVGDDDQSIYAFRGANIRNILEFEKDFSGAAVIRLEQNYRSDKRILDVANSVIKNNEGRKGKTLWSEINSGRKPILYTANSEFDEAETIAREIQRMANRGTRYADMAILYRIHTLSRVLEEKLRMYAVPYRIYGGISFYERKEIKDMIAYLNIIANPAADLQLTRIINMPKRAIGDAKVAALAQIAASNNMSMLEVMKNANVLIPEKQLNKKANEFYEMYTQMRDGHEEMQVHEILERIYELSGYKKMLEEEATPEAEARVENISELINSAYTYDSEDEASLDGFLQNIALITDLDSMDDKGGVTLMTMHAAKGLEFDVVFVAGMDESIFPSQRAIDEDNVEEERRLCYVAMTRAKKQLYMTHALMRTLYGKTQPSVRSRFLDEVEDGLLNHINKERKPVLSEKKQEKKKKSFFSGGLPEKTIEPSKVSGDFHVGGVVEHKSFGRGKIKSIAGSGDAQVAVVDFYEAGEKKMFLAFASLKILK